MFFFKYCYCTSTCYSLALYFELFKNWKKCREMLWRAGSGNVSLGGLGGTYTQSDRPDGHFTLTVRQDGHTTSTHSQTGRAEISHTHCLARKLHTHPHTADHR